MRGLVKKGKQLPHWETGDRVGITILRRDTNVLIKEECERSEL